MKCENIYCMLRRGGKCHYMRVFPCDALIKYRAAIGAQPPQATNNRSPKLPPCPVVGCSLGGGILSKNYPQGGNFGRVRHTLYEKF